MHPVQATPPTTFPQRRPRRTATEMQPRLSAPNLPSTTCPGDHWPSAPPADGRMGLHRGTWRARGGNPPPDPAATTRAVTTAHRHGTRLFESNAGPTRSKFSSINPRPFRHHAAANHPHDRRPHGASWPTCP